MTMYCAAGAANLLLKTDFRNSVMLGHQNNIVDDILITSDLFLHAIFTGLTFILTWSFFTHCRHLGVLSPPTGRSCLFQGIVNSKIFIWLQPQNEQIVDDKMMRDYMNTTVTSLT